MGKYLIPVDCIEMLMDSNPLKCDYVGFGGEIHSPDLSHATSNTIAMGSEKYYDDIFDTIRKISSHKQFILIDDYTKMFPLADSTTAYFLEQLRMKGIASAKDSLLRQMNAISDLLKQCLKDARLFINRAEIIP